MDKPFVGLKIFRDESGAIKLIANYFIVDGKSVYQCFREDLSPATLDEVKAIYPNPTVIQL